MLARHLCSICDADALETIPGYAALPRATSDSRPWPAGGTLAICMHCGAVQKIADARWLDEIDRIYRNYEIYHQSAGSEQLIFDDGGAAEARSKRLVDYIMAHASPLGGGKLLDIGCGNGATLRSFSQALPTWDLYGSELSTSTLDILRRIPNFVRLFVGPLAEIEGRFSLISLVHTLEHILRPAEALAAVATLLADEGILAIQVPNIEGSPFDLLVADHLLHFSRATLNYLVARSGLRSLIISNEVASKEITLLAKRGDAVAETPDPRRERQIAVAAVSWLEQVLELAENAASGGAIGIFGTAIAGMALYSALKDRVTFFVDEDKNRIGRHYDDRPVLAPAQAPKHIPVIVALPPPYVQPVADRCARFGLRCIVPPAIQQFNH